MGGRSFTSGEERDRLGLANMENWSLAGDAVIVLQSVSVAPTRKKNR